MSGRSDRAALVGDASLTSQCLDLALAGGLDVVVVATADAGVAEHAGSQGIPVAVAPGDLAAALAGYEFDVLLSVANLRILPASLLDRVTTAINFHDGPLPGYAGLHVTSWALLNGETEHAVTWHLMTDDVDAGDVVGTERFAIADDETAFSLNARCYEAAIASFPAVVADLVGGTLAPARRPQGERRLFRRDDRPATIVDPGTPATEIARTVRALDLGHQVSNPMGSVHLVTPNGQLLVTAARSIESDDDLPVGTLSGDEHALRLTTSSGDLLITALETPDGSPVTAGQAFELLGATPGEVVPSAPDGLSASFTAADPALARHESFWADRLATSVISTPPLLGADVPTASVERDLPEGADADDVIAAVAAWSWRLTNAATDETGAAALALIAGDTRSRIDEIAPLAAAPIARFGLDASTTFSELRGAAAAERATMVEHGPFLYDLVARTPELRGRTLRPAVAVELDRPAGAAPADAALDIALADRRLVVTGAVDAAGLGRIVDQIEQVLVGGLAAPDAPVDQLPLLGEAERRLLDAGNDTGVPFDATTTIDRLVADRIDRHPDAPAVTAGATTLSYRRLGERIAATAGRLHAAGVRRGDLVGIATGRGVDMVVSVLATHRCGAAYVPLDPGYPAERLQFMVNDSGLDVVVADSAAALDLGAGTTVVPVGADDGDPTVDPPADPGHDGSDLAYIIYTSGSTGTPKGVMLEHRNVVNFFTAMDAVIDHDPPGTWLAVTSLSFDISVLELLWTLARGFHVVIRPDGRAAAAGAASQSAKRPVSFSLFYFAAGEETAHDGYRLLLDSARWADEHGFEAVWTPERHFHAFGGAYPNPSVVGAALATATERIQIRAGSVVAPLHSPARIAEEWAVVDNLSGGRVGISFAGGWQPNDFVLQPDAYATAKERLPEMIETVQRLWRGESIALPGHDGEPVEVTTLPRPVQPELPVWLTSAGSPATFERAGTLGTHLLTHLLGQSIEQLAENIERYRAAWQAAGHTGEGQVTLMLHTYLHDDADTSRRIAHDPMKRYLGTAAGLLRNMASAFPIFASGGKDADEAFASLSADELDQLLEMAARRYLGTSGLFGTVDEAVDLVERCSHAGVDEIACLVDFGIDTDDVLTALPRLDELRRRTEAVRHGGDDEHTAGPAVEHVGERVGESFAALVERHGVTHLQCTPSLATMLVADPADRRALATIDHVMLGGETLPTALANQLRTLLSGRLTNMYGPTETTIWSLVHDVDDVVDGSVPIGRAIANTSVHVLDRSGARLPVGVHGELHIGGAGVARGYLGRDELTAERFVDRPDLGRTYATGDIVRVRADGVLEFAGRSDHQVKIRGHRIELGEIETLLDAHPDVVQSVVVAHRADARDPTLVAFVVMRDGLAPDETALRDLVSTSSPDAYVPGRFVGLDELPRTPNGKTDRGRLTVEFAASRATASAPPVVELDDHTEQLVADIWTSELGRAVGRDDNFFEIGGNSLLAVSVYRRVCDRTGAELALTDVFRHPTVRTFAAHLAACLGDGDNEHPEREAGSATTGTDRGARRRQALARRRSEVPR